MPPATNPRTADHRHWRLKLGLLALWAAVSFGVCFWARDIGGVIAGWPVDYWMAAQGTVLAFIGIVAGYAWAMNRIEAREATADRAVGDA